ncbi:MAG: DNA-formamidopyrimidine glycosylase [Pseudomonadales bacterium]|jgi:formamidopyrimidine-DNA glycosylase|uniref:bifunctional DNA-formamidopyrimidine glycosylase/DNA-(apurinic or apyrimidinic site) lyase n=1 Tax=unclassified Ketobacter TaxID=2639109 RepID=UPI000C64FD90|nr:MULTISPECIES: bifunctional DNA-formamidopyrimidine glycosylase/DNA-(apurinic or apyrimidinic site) lyase [unclassified Ketobacter]MAA59180.1 DNA-formamidopyrimidine glycosylase [Pseudomonadales bacterium]MEC8812437.1 bifunctional DNA-formamidopyrimidine glycosylase/DNA-(apurinic or apyrimidinic site) lyase [Pseudomonadota bacterium]TNC88981.1 MAG: DNA-formamidopyrimidine glycosylase [Alcanivorax sp.]HAG97020.1 DNA-formamidopyrimidine glycosylase [Gammaproteobacteria bacterium]MAQ23261.1 DNA|tara:strand:- start:2001 stop:2813 length:813 start_codon:yes stop_codon:yes gene_type:complete
MPELPEVETTRRGIEPHIVGKRVKALHVRQPRLRWPVPPAIHEAEGRKLQAVQRRGKYLLLRFSNGTIIAHLGMSGSMRIAARGEPPLFHDHVDLECSDGTLLRYCDPRRFGAWLWTRDDPLQHELIVRLGPEPLTEAFNVDYLVARAKGRKSSVKTFIMDSHVVVGVGNIYANEALFMAGIHPKRPAGRISRARYARLVSAIKAVLAASIDMGGTTLRDFVGGDGKPGYFKQTLRVYGRAGQPCVGCKGPLTEIRLGQRSTVFCKLCQT